MIKRILGLSMIALVLFSCKGDDDGPDEPCEPTGSLSPVIFNPSQVPYDSLSAYNFYEGELANLDPVYGVIPYDVITPLFADYAHKKRFVWMPDNVSATYDGDDKLLEFPESAVLLKSFYYDNVQPDGVTKILETRMLFKRNGEWEFAEYVWNEEQTEAYLDYAGSSVPVEWMDENNELKSVNFQIPSESQCRTCHKSFGNPIPIGPKPQHLDKDYEYEEGVKNQLAKWEEFGYITDGYPLSIVATVPWDDETQDLSERFRSYMDMNCAHCHAEGGHCDYRPMRLDYTENEDLIDQGVCIEAEQFIGESFTYIISAGDPNKSVMHERMVSVEENVRMPLMGRTLQHVEGVELIKEYINSLEDPCP